jgi:threonine dehydrogenase-like Zn-dependent dehydrogenase
MKVATWRGEAKFTIDEVPMPELEAGLVIVKVDSAGVCGTDVHVTQGLFTEWKPPMVLGHEFSGVIVDVGQGVPSERIGEHVVCLPQPGCGQCGPCKTWTIGHCEQLPRRAGSFAEYVMVDQNAAYILPEKLDLETASMVEPASCALSCVDSLGPQEKGFDALVIGAGLLGLFTVAFLKLRGAGRVIASEPHPIRREMARQFGADFVHDPSKSSLEETVEDLTDGTGVHVAVEAVGKPDLVAKCVELARPRGHVLMVGVSPRRSPLMIDLFEMHFKEISVRGAMGAGNSFGAALNLFPKINLEGVVGGRYPLEEIASVIQMSAAGEQVKFVIAPND